MVTPVLAALIGALIGSVSTQGIRELLDWRQRKRELRGLLRLIDGEIHSNGRQLEAYRDTPSWITDAPETTMRFEAWDASKVRLAQLLKDDTQFADINKCYENLRVIDEFRRSNTTDPAWRIERITKKLDELLEIQEIASNHIRAHVLEPIGTPMRTLENGENRASD